MFELPFSDSAPQAAEIEAALSDYAWFGSLRVWYSPPH